MTIRDVRVKLLLMGLCFVLLGFSPILGQGKGKGHSKKKDFSEHEEHANSVRVTVFHEHDKQLIFDYWHQQPGGLPPGLAKRHGDLPPGLEKQLRRNGHLPPGLEKRLVTFPPDLERRLPPIQSDHRRVIYGSIGIILNNKNIVVDFFDMSRR